MVYIFSTFDTDMFGYIFKALDEPVKIVTYPNSINNNSLIRKVAHALWKVGIFIKWNFFGKEFNDLLKSITPNDKVVFYANFPEHILNVVPHLKKKSIASVWLWDIMSMKPFLLSNLHILKKLNIPINTFEPQDAEQYNITYVPQVYNFLHPKTLVKENAIIEACDCYYLGSIGTDYRRNLVKQVEAMLLEQGVKLCTYLVNEDGRHYISYYQNLDNLTQCKALLELNNEGQGAPTLRAMEALSYHKKLITNNKDIRNFDFYRKSNIFILGEDDPTTLKKFVNSPYENVSSEIIERYDVNTWIKNMYK